MTQQLQPPRGISVFNAIARPLLAVGLPMGFNGLLTVPGRKTGQPRTTPVAIIEVDGRRWIWCPWGERHWVRNLRAAGRATIEVRNVMVPLEDGNHRVESLRRAGVRRYWAVVNFESTEARDEFARSDALRA